MKILISRAVWDGVGVEVNPDDSLITIYKLSRKYLPVLYLYGDQLPMMIVEGEEGVGPAGPSDTELLNMPFSQFCNRMGIETPKRLCFTHPTPSYSIYTGILRQGKYTFARIDGGYNITCGQSDEVIGFAKTIDKAKEIAIQIEREKESNQSQ